MIAQVVLGVAAGTALAAVFLAGLWLTVKRTLGDSERRLAVFAASSLARIALVSAGFVLLAKYSGPVSAGAALVAFVALRGIVIGRARSSIAAGAGDGA